MSNSSNNPLTMMSDNQCAEISKFDLLVKRHELKSPVPEQLQQVLSTCKIVLLCDDSESMRSPICEPGIKSSVQKQTTRWLELKKLAAVLIEFTTASNPEGLDIHFLNRPPKLGVVDMSGLQAVFADDPKGRTPLISALQRVYDHNIGSLVNHNSLLIVVITDGEPTDGKRNDLYRKLVQLTQGGNVHISFAECTDNAQSMEYLDEWDGMIRNFDNTDDYREETMRIKRIQGQAFKFDYTDYVIKILLATYVRWYFNLDQQNVSNSCDQACCALM